MATERPTNILLAKTDLTREQIDALSDSEAWAMIYKATGGRRKTDKRPQICFTGFGASKTEALQIEAEAHGMKVVTAVTKGLSYLCCGDNPGPSKIEKAKAQGVALLLEEQFHSLVETGELPPE